METERHGIKTGTSRKEIKRWKKESIYEKG